MAEKKEMDLGSFAARLNHQIVRKAHTLYDRKKMNDVSMLNMWVADFLYDRKQEGKTVFQKDVEAEFGINRATASKMLALMEEKGLIRRTSLEADGRYKSIELEPEGLKLQKPDPRRGGALPEPQPDRRGSGAVPRSLRQDDPESGTGFRWFAQK